jgi:hypothetical protein
MAKVIDRSGPLPIYSAIVLCCTSQIEVAEGLLLGEWPSQCSKWASCTGLMAYL